MKIKLWPFNVWLVGSLGPATYSLKIETENYEFGLLIFRRWRSGSGWEWSPGSRDKDGRICKGTRWFNIYWGDPLEHRWWATSIYIKLG